MSGFLSPTLDIATYKRHLVSIDHALSPVEAALAKADHWHLFPSVKHRAHFEALQHDLLLFGLADATRSGRAIEGDFSHLPTFLGALYVLEGSALGGALLAKAIAHQLGLSPQNGLAYFSAQAASGQKRWQDFKKEMQNVLPQGEFAVCLESAIETFRRFS